jgi:hypothetical protein
MAQSATCMESNTTRFPRLLVVTDFTPEPVSGSALIRQMLRGYPVDQLQWWVSASEPSIAADPMLRNLHRYPVPARLRPHRRLSRLKCWLLERIWVPRAARDLRAFVARRSVDQLWVQLSDWAIPVLRRSGLVRTHRCHVSLWDYHTARAYLGLYGERRARRFARWAEELFLEATTCAVISQAMRDDLAARTGRSDALVFHSGFEPSQLDRLAGCAPEPASEIRIAYAGTIIVPEVFHLFIRALDQVRRDLPRPVTLHLFSQRFGCQPWFDGTWMRDHGFLEEERFFEELQRCTWGFLPMALTDDDPAYSRYSFPNKYGTYLSAGLPLIILAHSESSAAKMFRQYPTGVWSDATHQDALVSFLRTVLAEPVPPARFRAEILRCAQTEFDADRMRRRLWACLGAWGTSAAPADRIEGGERNG